MVKALRICIYQPQAHYRIPFTYQRRHTYPLPPYSTVFGFLINAMGLIDQRTTEYQKLKELKLSVSGRFETKTTEYIWFRNLSKKSHIDKYGSVTNREINGHIQHPGGQSPISIDVLDEVYLNIYLWHQDDSFLKKIKDDIIKPVNRLEVIHLGRAEDWIVYQGEIKFVSLSKTKKDANYRHFFWIPEERFTGNSEPDTKETDGLIYRMPTFATIDGYEETFDRHAHRNFDFISVRLNEGINQMVCTPEQALDSLSVQAPRNLPDLRVRRSSTRRRIEKIYKTGP